MNRIFKTLGVVIFLMIPVAVFGQGRPVAPKRNVVKQAASKSTSAQKPTSAQQEVIDNIIANMVNVKGSGFMMGSNTEEAYPDEGPVHDVTVGDFMIGKFEVTQREWETIMGENPSVFSGDEDEDSGSLPVEYVSWNDVELFIIKLNRLSGKNFRLPTEAEWEYAARGGTRSNGYSYSGSDDIEEVAWYGRNSDRRTHPVGKKKPNELGLYDMSGNVWEWTADKWSPDYTMPRSRSNFTDRGGCWGVSARDCRVSCRGGDDRTTRLQDIGFRLAADPF